VGSGLGRRGNGNSSSPPSVSNGTIDLFDWQETRWVGYIDVGTPPTTFTINFDTGSGTLFLPGLNCGNCTGHHQWDPSTSSTAKNTGKNTTSGYADGSQVAGTVWTDDVYLGGYKIQNQTILVADTYTEDFGFASDPSDGLLGLGFPASSVNYTDSAFFNLVNQSGSGLPEPVFAFYLSNQGSELTIGGTNKELYTGNITYAPVTGAVKQIWEVDVDKLSLNNQTILSNFSGIVDSGTTAIRGNETLVAAFYQSINGTSLGGGSFVAPCDQLAEQQISFTIQGKEIDLTFESLNLGTFAAPNGTLYCLGGIVGDAGLDVDTWILGDVFMKNVYTIFDAGKARVGFADLATSVDSL